MIVADARRGLLRCGDLEVRCALGRGGVTADKREGDGASPLGIWPMRCVFYRPDRLPAPPLAHGLEVFALAPDDLWCDDPAHPDYNLRVKFPHPASCETLWREDHLYDVIVPLGYNDDPIHSGRGSAIFLHVALPDYSPTHGCVAVALPDLLSLLREPSHQGQVNITTIS